MDELDHVTAMNMGSSDIGKRFGGHFSKGLFHKVTESGTCNVCGTPCSSCMHVNLASSPTGPKSVEHSAKACHEKKMSGRFYDDADMSYPFKGNSCDKRQRTSSETSNLVNPCSSHDSFSENSESKVALNAFDTSEDAGILFKRVRQKKFECDVETLQATAVFSNKSDPSEISSLRDVFAGPTSPKGEHSECSTEQVESSLARVENFTICCQQDAHDSAESGKIQMEIVNGRSTAETVNRLDQNEYFEKSCASLDIPNLQNLPLQSQADGCIDGSENVENEVKVCDICGDAGREYLLAVCSKCSDGAEHTYCMRIKLDEVPEGNWLCEECMLEEKSEKQKLDVFGHVVKTSKGTYSEKLTSSKTFKSNNSLKLDIKDSSLKSRTNRVSSNPHLPSKRSAGNLATSSWAKRKALGTSKVSSPCRKALLSRTSSFKTFHDGKFKLDHHKSSHFDHPSTHIMEKGQTSTISFLNSPKSQLQLSHGSLLKSKSFREHDVFRKKEIVTGDRKKEGTVRVLGKSMSFSGATSEHSNITDSKLKSLPSNVSCPEDLTRLQNAKDQNSFKRKDPFRLDNSLAVAGSGAASKTVKKVPFSGDGILPLPSQSRAYDLKAVPYDQSSNNLSKPSFLAQEHSAYEERPCMRDLPRLFPVPALDYIWRGGFEIQRTGRLPRFCDGIQAHLSSTCTSLYVLEAVSKFPHKLVLEEVSRLKTWPTQFFETHPSDDNIALYFFAEDMDSYGNYKSLLESMKKNDFALQGNIEGVEVLIFSSDLLPKKSQRWNKLLYLWGVFRGRKSNYPCIPNLNVVPSDDDTLVPINEPNCYGAHYMEMTSSPRPAVEVPNLELSLGIMSSGNNNKATDAVADAAADDDELAAVLLLSLSGKGV